MKKHANKPGEPKELSRLNEKILLDNQVRARKTAALLETNKLLVAEYENNIRSSALIVLANEQLLLQKEKKISREAELMRINVDLTFQNHTKELHITDLILTNQSLTSLNKARQKRALALTTANKELKQKGEDIRRKLIEKSSDIIILTDSSGLIIYCSPSIQNIFGYSADEFSGKPVLNYIHPEDIPAMNLNTAEISAVSGKSFYCQQRLLRKDGHWIYCEGNITNLLDDPSVHAMVFNFKDVTERKAFEMQQEFDKNNLAALIDNTTDLMWSVDRKLKLISSNESFRQTVKASQGDALEKGCDIFTGITSLKQINHYKLAYERAFAGEIFLEIEHETFPEENWLEISFRPILMNTEVIGVACQTRDITLAKKSERQLRESALFTRGVLNSLASHIAVINQEGLIIDVNEVWELFAIENCPVVSQQPGKESSYFDACKNAIADGDLHAAKALQGIKNIFLGVSPVFYMEYPCHSPTKKRWFGMRASKFESKGAFVVVSHLDITDRRKAEQILRRSEGRLREAQGIAKIGSWEADFSTENVIWSDETYRVFGVDRKEKQLSYIDFLGYVHPDDKEKVNLAFTDSWAHDKANTLEHRIITPAGIIKNIEDRWRIYSDGASVKAAGTVQDITERKNAETERSQIIKDLIHRNQDLEQFSYIISHNLRAPVANIIGITNILNDFDLEPDEKNRLIGNIHDSVLRLDHIIQDLNNILKVKAEITEDREYVRFSALVENIKLSIQTTLVNSNVVISYDFSALDELFTIKSYLYSIFYNLIYNSVKFCKPEQPCKISVMSRLAGSQVELSFTDNGMGFHLKNTTQAFGLYNRFHPHIDGKGMGLFMVKTQVEMLGGHISLQSELNKGSTFKIEIGL